MIPIRDVLYVWLSAEKSNDAHVVLVLLSDQYYLLCVSFDCVIFVMLCLATHH